MKKLIIVAFGGARGLAGLEALPELRSRAPSHEAVIQNFVGTDAHPRAPERSAGRRS